MRWSPARWTLACVLGCVLASVAFLPPADDERDTLLELSLASPTRIREYSILQRYNVTWQHSRLLTRSYKAAQNVETANRVFGAHHESAAKPVIYYGPDIPTVLRSQVQVSIDKELAARGEWTGHGAVGIMVVSDTASTIGGVHAPYFYERDRPLSTLVLPATPENGNHCVSVVRLRHQVFTQPPAGWNTGRLLLDGCAFTDAFGAPGPRIAEWLTHSRYSLARRLSYAPADTARQHPWYWYNYSDDQSRRCRGGMDSSCVAAVTAAPRDEGYYGWRSDLSVQAPDASDEVAGELGGFRQTFMEGLARDLGSSRFQRLWRSPKPLDEAYFDETGEQLATWIRARQSLVSGPYHIGPLQPPSSAFLTVLSVLILAAIAVRFAPRPYKI